MTEAEMTALLDLAECVNACKFADNALDVQVEIALFEPDELYSAVRADSAGTKVIYTRVDGSEQTHWADTWTCRSRRWATAAALRARAQQ